MDDKSILALLQENNRLLKENNAILKELQSIIREHTDPKFIEAENTADFIRNVNANLIAKKFENILKIVCG